MPCTPQHDLHSLVLDRLVEVLNKLVVVGRLVASMVLERKLACCRFALGSSCHIGCGEPKMELGILDKLVHDKLVLAHGKFEVGRLVVGGSWAVVVDGSLVARIHHCKLDR